MIAGRLLLVGAGNMGGAMLARWLDAGLDPALVTVISPSRRVIRPRVRVVPALPDGETFDVIVLALKPQQLGALASPAFASLAPRLLVSILAGVEVAILGGLCRAGAVVRAMPNLPVSIGQGVVALFSETTDAGVRDEAAALAAPLGHYEWIADEAQFDAVTALSGCGPGFVFRFIDALAKAGAALGLPADQAARLALATVSGSATLAAGNPDPPATLADRVASPGGSTREGLNVLDRDGALIRLIEDTLRASRDRNVAMALAARG